MIRPRLLALLAGVALALASLAAPAWAHPGHESTDGPAAAANSWDALGRHAPTAIGLLAAALSLLAGSPHRRRALSLALVLLVATVFLEGMFHAALHLQKIRHAQSLAIGASPAQQAATGPGTDGPSATPFIRLIEVAQHYDAPGPDVAVASNRGRAPPTSPT
jgi:hypothetical protein